MADASFRIWMKLRVSWKCLSFSVMEPPHCHWDAIWKADMVDFIYPYPIQFQKWVVLFYMRSLNILVGCHLLLRKAFSKKTKPFSSTDLPLYNFLASTSLVVHILSQFVVALNKSPVSSVSLKSCTYPKTKITLKAVPYRRSCFPLPSQSPAWNVQQLPRWSVPNWTSEVPCWEN